MKLVGRVERQFFGGDVWVLVTKNGVQYQLDGKVPASLDGQEVEVKGEKSKAGFGIAMVGEIIALKSIRAI